MLDWSSLQSSALLLLPRVTYARLASTCQVTCTGGLQGATPPAGLLLLLLLLGEPEEWPPVQI